jgi:hypothetical protein
VPAKVGREQLSIILYDAFDALKPGLNKLVWMVKSCLSLGISLRINILFLRLIFGFLFRFGINYLRRIIANMLFATHLC